MIESIEDYRGLFWLEKQYLRVWDYQRWKCAECGLALHVLSERLQEIITEHMDKRKKYMRDVDDVNQTSLLIMLIHARFLPMDLIRMLRSFLPSATDTLKLQFAVQMLPIMNNRLHWLLDKRDHAKQSMMEIDHRLLTWDLERQMRDMFPDREEEMAEEMIDRLIPHMGM